MRIDEDRTVNPETCNFVSSIRRSLLGSARLGGQLDQSIKSLDFLSLWISRILVD
jgi:hypothetical protein